MELRCEITKFFPGRNRTPHSFLAAIVEVDFPLLMTIESRPFAVVAANYIKGGEVFYGWVNLSSDEKICIGDELLKQGAKNNEWFECILYKTENPCMPEYNCEDCLKTGRNICPERGIICARIKSNGSNKNLKIKHYHVHVYKVESMAEVDVHTHDDISAKEIAMNIIRGNGNVLVKDDLVNNSVEFKTPDCNFIAVEFESESEVAE